MSVGRIRIDKEVADALLGHAEATFPNECCGFLFGQDGDIRRISASYAVPNAQPGDQRRRFVILPKAYLDAERFALTNDLDFLGIYHSHPDHSAIASDYDLQMAMPHFSYVILSVMQGLVADIKSWRLSDEARVFEEEMVDIDRPHSIINQLKSLLNHG